jgi:hypothetical protein
MKPTRNNAAHCHRGPSEREKYSPAAISNQCRQDVVGNSADVASDATSAAHSNVNQTHPNPDFYPRGFGADVNEVGNTLGDSYAGYSAYRRVYAYAYPYRLYEPIGDGNEYHQVDKDEGKRN